MLKKKLYIRIKRIVEDERDCMLRYGKTKNCIFIVVEKVRDGNIPSSPPPTQQYGMYFFFIKKRNHKGLRGRNPTLCSQEEKLFITKELWIKTFVILVIQSLRVEGGGLSDLFPYKSLGIVISPKKDINIQHAVSIFIIVMHSVREHTIPIFELL